MENNYLQYKDALILQSKRFGIGYNINEPVTIQDKLNWLKIYDSTALKTKCADKILLHEYCKEKLGKDICVPILKIYNNVDEINWDELPNQFVIKCNHGSGMNFIVKDKNTVNKNLIKQNLNEFMKIDWAFKVGYEMHYHNIEHKIFVEKFMTDNKQKNFLYDYKFWCFNGEPKFYTNSIGIGHGPLNHYTLQHELIPWISRTDYPCNENEKNPIPMHFEEMVEFAKILSSDFKFVRVDFYEVDNVVYLGELTFIPGAAFFKYKDSKCSKMLGDLLDLKNK